MISIHTTRVTDQDTEAIVRWYRIHFSWSRDAILNGRLIHSIREQPRAAQCRCGARLEVRGVE